MADLPTVPASCRNETCQFCGAQATRKISEEILEPEIEPIDDSETGQHYGISIMRHPYTCYVCEEHFWMVMRQPMARAAHAIMEPCLGFRDHLIGDDRDAMIEYIKDAVDAYREAKK